MNYFYDSYAIIEFAKGNKKYIPFFAEKEGITTYENLLEVFYSFLRTDGLKTAQYILKQFSQIMIEPSIKLIEPTAQFKYKNKKKKFSYADCTGYVIAQEKNIKFLTGDEGFRGMKNVKFVK